MHEALGRVGYLGPEFRPAWSGARIGGTAVTVLCWPGDNLMIHVAVEQCRPGDVLVVATNSPSTDGLFGELFATALAHRGVRGVVLGCGVRDVAELQEMGFPAWSRAVSAQGSVKATAGAVNVPVVLGGQRICAGDVVVADDDGVMVVPRADVPRALTASQARIDKEAASRAAFQQGELGLDRYGLRDKLPGLRHRVRPLREVRRGSGMTLRRERRPLPRCSAAARPGGSTSRRRTFPPTPAARDDLLLRLMGTPDPRQIDGLGGATTLTSKVAVVSPSDDPDVDVDYLFLQLGVDEATVSDLQNCGNILAGVGPFAVERGLVPAGDAETSVRIRMVNSDSVAVATFPTPGGQVEYRGDVAIAGVPGTAAPVVLAFADTEGSATGALLPTGNVRDTVEGIEVTCVDNGMPVVLALAESFGLTGYEPHEQLAADAALLERIDAFRRKAAELMGMGDVSRASVPKTVLLARRARRRAGLHPVVHPGAAAHLDRRPGRGQRRHRDAAARRGRARADRRLAAGHLAGRRRAPDRPPAGRRRRRRRGRRRRGWSAPASSAPPASCSTAPRSRGPEPHARNGVPPCLRCTTSRTSPTSSCSPTSRRRASTSTCATSG